MTEAREATIALRWAIPFVRITGVDPQSIDVFAREGITLRDFTNPDTRIRHRAVMELLERAVLRMEDPGFGLRAGMQLEAGDLDVLEYATRSCSNLREAMHCTNRYMYLMHTAQEAQLIEEGELAIWELRITDGVPQPPAANDFALAAACSYARRYTGQRNVLREVRFRHAVATDPVGYAQFFDGAEIKFGAPHNALVFARGHLDSPMSHANPGLQAAFELHASAMLERLRRTEGISGRVRHLLVEQLRAGDVSMTTVARRLAMSVATLRRRLSEDGTSHSELLDEVRRDLAERYLADMSLAISEVAFLLGFSHVTAFYKAFRRWTNGITPADFRAQHQRR